MMSVAGSATLRPAATTLSRMSRSVMIPEGAARRIEHDERADPVARHDPGGVLYRESERGGDHVARGELADRLS